MKNRANPAVPALANRFFGLLLLVALLPACSSLPDKPVRPTVYDFGPGAAAPAPGQTPTASPKPAIALQDAEPGGAFDTAAMTYRLAYADAQVLRPYARARWSVAPTHLVRQRVREIISRERPVLALADAQAQGRLQLELEEFSQVFTSPATSHALVRLRATYVERSPAASQRRVLQRTFTAQAPAPTPDAPGAAKALAEAVGALANELAQWLGP